MTRQKYDLFSKQFVADLLGPQGNANVHYEIPPGEAHHADVYFVPAPDADLQTLGLLGKIAAKPCLIEPFRNQPSRIEIQICLQKLFTLRSELLNEVERKKKALKKEEHSEAFEPPQLKEDELPHLWILATSASDNLLNVLGAETKPDWCKGVYFCAEINRTAIVTINRLPPTPETLLLRLLGKGATQAQAIEEVRAFPENHPLRNRVEELLGRWRIYVTKQDELTTDDEELLMNLSQIYEDWRKKTLQEGYEDWREKTLQEGRLEERRAFVENMLGIQFGVIDEVLSQVIKRLLKLPPEESSHLILQSSSREELLSKFSH